MKTVESEEPPSDHVPVQLTINDCHGKDVDDGDVSKIKVPRTLFLKWCQPGGTEQVKIEARPSVLCMIILATPTERIVEA